MTDLADKAESGPDVTLAPDLLEGQYSYEDTELIGADELTDEGEFPQYGEFLPVDERSPYDGGFREQTHIQVPTALAKWLIENTKPGDWWQVTEAKKVGGRWQIEASNVSDDSD